MTDQTIATAAGIDPAAVARALRLGSAEAIRTAAIRTARDARLRREREQAYRAAGRVTLRAADTALRPPDPSAAWRDTRKGPTLRVPSRVDVGPVPTRDTVAAILALGIPAYAPTRSTYDDARPAYVDPAAVPAGSHLAARVGRVAPMPDIPGIGGPAPTRERDVWPVSATSCADSGPVPVPILRPLPTRAQRAAVALASIYARHVVT